MPNLNPSVILCYVDYHPSRHYFHVPPQRLVQGRICPNLVPLCLKICIIDACTYLLRLLRLLCVLRSPALASSLRSLWASLSVQHVIPPSETASIVSNETFVVDIVVLGTSPERNDVVQAPWEIVAAVSIDSLEETGRDPEVHSYNVEVTRHQAPDDWNEHSTSTENHGLDGRSIFSSESERCRVLVVDFVNISVEESHVKESVHPVMPCILQDEKDGDLDADRLPCWKRHAGIKTAGLRHWMEEPDLREFDGEMGEENQFRACPLFLPRRDLQPLNFIFIEVWDRIDDDPGKTAAEIDRFVHDEAHDTGRKNIVLHVGIPTLPWIVRIDMVARVVWSTYSPETLENVQMHIVLGHLIVDTQVCFGGCQSGIGHERSHNRDPADVELNECVSLRREEGRSR